MNSPKCACTIHIPFEEYSLISKIGYFAASYISILILAIFTGICLALVSDAIAKAPDQSVFVMIVAGMFGFGAFAGIGPLSMLRRQANRPESLAISLTNSAITQGEITIPWASIDGCIQNQGFVFKDTISSRKIFLFPRHKDYTKALEEIARRCPYFRRGSGRSTKISGISVTLLTLFFPGLVVLWALTSELFLVGVIVWILILLQMLSQYHTVRIERGTLTLKGFLRKKVFKLRDLSGVQIKSRDHEGQTVVVCEITTNDNSTQAISMPAQSHTLAIYRAISDTLEQQC